MNYTFRGEERLGAIQKMYHTYNQLRIVEVTIHEIEAAEAFLIIEGGIWLCAGCLFACLRLYDILPFEFYILYPFITIAAIGVSQLLLSSLKIIDENSSMALVKWKEQLGGMENVGIEKKYLRRKFKALRPMRFIAGIGGSTFFIIDKSTTPYFLRSILDNLINLFAWLPELGTSKIQFMD